MPLRARVLTAVAVAVALLAGSGAARVSASAAPVRSAGYVPKHAVAVGMGGAVASADVEATSAGLEVRIRG
jgi:hypothetical protein